MWFGPVPRVIITNPEQVKEIFSKFGNFRKPQLNPLVNYLLSGLVKLEDDKWAMHRKIINPAFHMEKLKVLYIFPIVIFFHLFYMHIFTKSRHIIEI